MPSNSAISGWSMAAVAAPASVVAGNSFDTPNPPPPIPQADIMGEPKPIMLPADVVAKLSGIAPEKVALIKEGRTGRYVEKDVLFDRIRTLPAVELAAYIDAIAALHAQVEYKEGRDAKTIPLDTRSAWFNAWKAKRPLVMDPKREAGPMDLGRYIGG